MAQVYKPKNSRAKHQVKKRAGANKGGLAHSALQQDLRVTVADHSGNGLCLETQPLTVIKNALAGEHVKVKITQQSKRVNFATAIKVLKPSEYRTEPFCEYYGRCGGCSMQHTSPEHALSEKQTALQNYIENRVQVATEKWVSPIRASISYSASANDIDSYGYRRRVKLAIDARNINAVKIGYREAASNKIVDVRHCAITVSEINQHIASITDRIKTLDCVDKIGHIVITQGYRSDVSDTSVQSKNTQLQLAIFCVKTLSNATYEQLSEFASNTQLNIVIHQKNQAVVGINKASTELCIYPNNHIVQAISADQFLQVNESVNHDMVALALTWLASTKQQTLYDFFCGSGNFALALSTKFDKVIAYEGAQSMVDSAIANAKRNHITNCVFAKLDLSDEHALANINIEKNSAVVLDPSREGALALSKKLCHSKVQTIVYVSCNANTFIRDFAELQTHYTLEKITALDMFPFTSHLEVMALLHRK